MLKIKANKMTVQELLNVFSEFNLKAKQNVPVEYEVTNDDIIRGNMFQRYIYDENVSKVVCGLDVINGEICYVYSEIVSIEIKADDFFPACGGKSTAEVYANYNIQYKAYNGRPGTIVNNGKCKVNGIITVNNPLFTYSKPYLINEQPNNSDINIEVDLRACYYYKSQRYDAVKHVVQRINSISDWLVKEEPTQFLTLKFSDNDIANTGGYVTVTVERHFARLFYKKDSCGNIVGEKNEPNNVEDITSKCLITSSNRKAFIVTNNIIKVERQELSALKREAVITARYMDVYVSETLRQNEGGKITYKQELSFPDGKNIKFFDVDTSLPTKKKIYIISKEHKYVDGEYYSTALSNEVKIESDSIWLNGVIGEDENGMNICVRLTEPNLDKDNDREGTLIVTSTEDPSLSIRLIVSQPSLDIVSESYICNYYCEDNECTLEELKQKQFYFHPYKIIEYENGESKQVEIEDYFKPRYILSSSNAEIINIAGVERKHGNYYLKFNVLSQMTINDIILSAKIQFLNTDNEIAFESKSEDIIVKGEDIIDYNYEFCFDNHSKYSEQTWFNQDKTPRTLNITSLKYKLVNGFVTGNEQFNFKIRQYDKDGNDNFNDNFSVKRTKDGSVIVFPYKAYKYSEATYTLIQEESGNKIELKLNYIPNGALNKINLKVIAYSDNIKEDVWTGDNAFLMIDNKDIIKLAPCWLYPTMENKVDTAFEGSISLDYGAHIFETINVIALEREKKTHRDCNVVQVENVDENTTEIVVKIKI